MVWVLQSIRHCGKRNQGLISSTASQHFLYLYKNSFCTVWTRKKELKNKCWFFFCWLYFVVRQLVANQQFCLPVPQLLISLLLLFFIHWKKRFFCVLYRLFSFLNLICWFSFLIKFLFFQLTVLRCINQVIEYLTIIFHEDSKFIWG